MRAEGEGEGRREIEMGRRWGKDSQIQVGRIDQA